MSTNYDNENSAYFLRFMLGNTENGHVTNVEQEFDLWGNTEFETIIQELKNCLLACGYTENLINSYIPEF